MKTTIAAALVLCACTARPARVEHASRPAFGATKAAAADVGSPDAGTVDKVYTAASTQEAADLKAAIFKQYRAQQLQQRGATELDIDTRGRVAAQQITTSYVETPAPAYDDATHTFTPADPKAVTVDSTVQSMQGTKVDIGDGKTVTIDVSTAVDKPAAQQVKP